MTHPSAIPHSIRLLHDIALQLTAIEPILDERQSFLPELMAAGPETDLLSVYIPDELMIRYFQVMMLMGVSFSGGLFVESLKLYDSTESQVKLIWGSGIRDTFKWGEDDSAFRQFAKYYGSTLFRPARVPFTFTKSYLAHIAKLLMGYIRTINIADIRFRHFITHKTDFIEFLMDDFPADLFFVTMACLPTEELNALLLYIQNYLPDDLTIKNPQGQVVNVCQLLGSASQDIYFLIEKLRVYFELYYRTEMPIIKEITHIKTKLYLDKMLKNPNVLNQVLYNLESMKANHLDSRLQLYRLAMTHFSMILTSNTAAAA